MLILTPELIANVLDRMSNAIPIAATRYICH